MSSRGGISHIFIPNPHIVGKRIDGIYNEAINYKTVSGRQKKHRGQAAARSGESNFLSSIQ